MYVFFPELTSPDVKRKGEQEEEGFPKKIRTGENLKKQGSKCSAFSLISDFFPTPRTILEISVNLMRKDFRRGGGRGIGVH